MTKDDHTDNPDPMAAYYDEYVTIILSRLSLLAIVSACMLALKHPSIPKDASTILTYALRDLTILVDSYAPPEVLDEWTQLLQAS